MDPIVLQIYGRCGFQYSDLSQGDCFCRQFDINFYLYDRENI